MKPGRIVFLLCFAALLGYGYWRSLRPIVRFTPVSGIPAALEARVASQPSGYLAVAMADNLYAIAWSREASIQIQGVYWSKRPGMLEVAVSSRPAAAPGGVSAVTVDLPAARWPSQITFRSVTGDVLSTQPVLRAGEAIP